MSSCNMVPVDMHIEYGNLSRGALRYPKDSVFLGVMFYFRIMECGTWSQLASTKRRDFMLICLSFSRDETSAE